MGGINSGRRQTSNKRRVENCLCLDICTLNNEQNYFSENILSLSWDTTLLCSPERSNLILYLDTSLIKFESRILCEQRIVPSGKTEFYNIDIEYTYPNFGGTRIWFKCPVTKKRTTKLFLPIGSTYFASREAYDLVYQYQYEAGILPHVARKQKLEKQVQMINGYYARPKGMHKKIFTNIISKIDTAHNLSMVEMDLYTNKLHTHWSKNPIE